MDPYAIDIAACRGRQARVLELMQQQRLDAVLVTQIEHVQYLAGPRFAPTFQPAALLTSDGRLTLVAPQKAPEVAAADEVLIYEAKWLSTMRNDQRATSAQVLLKARAGLPTLGRVGVEFSTYSLHYEGLAGEVVDIEPELYLLRRRKDPDELARLRKAIAATGKMYETARAMIRPGVNELNVFNALQAAAVRECGEMLTGTGNDYQCAARGGAPRNREAAAGELYILDLGPAFRGYFADNARTIAVAEPTEVQREAWRRICEVFDHVAATVRPGKSCRQLFEEVQAMLDQAPVGKFNHHLGHGIGLFPHEGPHLNPNWDDTFEVGQVFACEPGLYAPELNAGMRLENDYLVTENGVELLSDFPLELKL
jgi:Xaa-Pro aminopeptidase